MVVMALAYLLLQHLARVRLGPVPGSVMLLQLARPVAMVSIGMAPLLGTVRRLVVAAIPIMAAVVLVLMATLPAQQQMAEMQPAMALAAAVGPLTIRLALLLLAALVHPASLSSLS